LILTKLSEQGTFKLVSITKTTGRVMMFMLGERNDCIAWYVTKSESWADLEIALLRLKTRLEKKNALHQLKYWYTDT